MNFKEYQTMWSRTKPNPQVVSEEHVATMKSELRPLLTNNVCHIVFKKSDDTLRTMRCTLSENYLPKSNKEQSSDTIEDRPSQAVWDLSLGEWRSFRWDGLVDYQKEVLAA